MRKHLLPTLVTVSALVVFCAAVLASDSSKAPNATGQWMLNLQKSDFGKMPPPRAGSVTVKDDGEKLSWSYTGEDATGKKTQSSFDGAFDGNPYSLKGSEKPTSVSYKRSPDGAIAGTWKEGEHTTTQTISFSPDGKTMTITNNGTGPSGEPMTWTEVWEKTE